MKTIPKVIAYIVKDDKLLVFIHLEDNDPTKESGIQVPAGTIQINERSEDAVLREAHEETGLKNLRIMKKLGELEYNMQPYADEIHHRHFFWLVTNDEIKEEWEHTEVSDNGAKHPFKFYWIPIKDAQVLAAEQGAMLGKLNENKSK